MKEIQKAIETAKYIISSPTEEHGGFHPQTVEACKTALSILLHVKEHGLALTEEEIFKSLPKVWRVNGKTKNLPKVIAIETAKSIVAKQKGLI